MGQLSEWAPPAEEEVFFKNLIRILDEVYPDNWRDWVVNTPTYTDLFGEAISSDLECRLRFAVPTVRLARAHSQENSLSERRYRKIKRILLSWPIGRALIHTPLSIMVKVHPIHPGNKFPDAVNAIKGELIPRHEASKLLRGDSVHGEESTSSSTRASKRSHSPDPPPASKEPRMSEFMAQQNFLLEKLCQLVQTTNENVNTMLNKGGLTGTSVYSQCSSSPAPPQSYNEERQTLFEDESVEDNWRPPTLVNEQLDNVEEDDLNTEPLEDFAPGTKETEGKITKADETLVKQGCDCQRFNSESWQNIRYAEVQKTFQATPAFTSLKVNGNLATVTPTWQLVSVLEKMDLCLAAITHGLLQQRQTFQDIYKSAPASVKSHISKYFLAPESTFRKTSDSLLQYVCGRRAEVIQQRRGIYKSHNKTLNEMLHVIPPSETHLFAEPQLSEFVKEQGGVSKLFPSKRRTVLASTLTNRSAQRDRRMPPASTTENRDRPQSSYNQRNSTNRRPDRPRFQTKRPPPTKQNKNKKW